MDTKELADGGTDDQGLMPELIVAEDAEEVPAVAMHPLVVATRQLEILQNQIFLAGPTNNIQAQSTDDGLPATGEDTAPYCRLACDVLSCTVSACELWRESLLRHPAPINTNCPPISTAELYRLLSKLLASMHILDCLKDSKQALRVALSAVTAQEGDEQQLLTAVQDFFNMPTACLVLLRDMLVEQPEALAQTKVALFKMLEFQHAAVDGACGQEGERKWGSFKSKLGLSASSVHGGSDASNAGSELHVTARSSSRIALSLLINLYCSVENADQDHQASQPPSAEGPPGMTPKAQATVTQRLKTCVATLRSTPVVPGYGDVAIDLLRPVQGLSQLVPPWEPQANIEAAAMEERYSLSIAAAAAAIDYGRVVEELLALKLQYESLQLADDGRNSSAGGSSGPTDVRTSAPDVSIPCRSQASLSRAVAALASRGLHLLQDWQAALLQLDAYRTWHRRQKHEEEARDTQAEASVDQTISKPNPPRCMFTALDMPEVVRMISYIKGLHGVLSDNMFWVEPLLRVHCASHLGQLLKSVIIPVASGVLGLAPSAAPPTAAAVVASLQQQHQLAPLAVAPREGHPSSAPSSARGTGTGSVFAPTHGCNGTAAAAANDAEAEAAANLVAGFGRIWKSKALRHGRSASTASSLEVMAPEARQVPAVPLPNPPAAGQTETIIGPSQRTTEDSADTGNLIASITADGMDWPLARPGEFRSDPYMRLREWFATGTNPNGAATVSCLNVPLQSVPEGTPSSEKLSPTATAPEAQARRAVTTPTAEAGSVAAGNTSSIPRGSCEQAWACGSGARLATTTGTDGTEDGVECTVSSVSDCEGLMAALDSEEEACDSGNAVPDDGSQNPVDEPCKEPAAVQMSPNVRAQPQQPWPAADLLWPPPPVPSASWLAGGVSPANPQTAVSAGGASNGALTNRSPAGAPRLTAPAALSTNPLYIYPSAAREAVAEQERATVAIWMASEGGAAAPPALMALDQQVATCTTAEGAMPEDSGTPSNMDVVAMQQRQGDINGVRIYCDDLGASPQIDSAMRPRSYDISNVRLDVMQPHDDVNGYCDDIHVSHAQLEAPYLPQPEFGDIRASRDGAMSQMHYDAAPPSQAIKKTTSSPFKRIKKMFSKRAMITEKVATTAPLQYDDAGIPAVESEAALEAYYGVDCQNAMAGFGGLPAPYLADAREVASFDLESSALFGVQGANLGAYGVGMAGSNPHIISGDFLPGIMVEAAARDGAVAVLSVGPAGQVQGGQNEQLASGEADMNPAGGRGKSRPSAGGAGTIKGAAAFLELAARAREEQSCQRLRLVANDMQVCLANAGFSTGAERASAPAGLSPGQRMFRAARKGAPGGARASFKKLVTSIKARGRNRSGGGSSAAADQDVHTWACDAAQSLGLDAQSIARLRNSAELMAEELSRWLNNRRERGKSTKEGPSTMQLLALSSELRTFLATDLPSLEPLMSYSASLAAAADLSPLLLLDPSRPYGGAAGSGLTSDARGSIPWELANKGVLMAAGVDGNMNRTIELPLSAGLTVLSLYKDAVDALQMQQGLATSSGYPEPPTAARLQLLYRRQAKWCVGTFVQMAARKVWGTFKAQAVRSKLGVSIPSGAPDVAASTVSFQGLFRPQREEGIANQLLMLVNASCAETSFTIVDQLSGAIDDLVRQSAARVADLLLGSDLTSLVAVKQQLDVLSTAVSRLRQELPSIRPWKDVWLAALAARAASSPTCATIAEAAAATAAAVTQGCGSSAAGITISADDIVLTHACSVAALRTLSTWSYDMIAVKFRPTKHTKSIWESLVGHVTPDTTSQLLFPDGADIAMASLAVDTPPGVARPVARGPEANTTFFSRSHVQALHGLLGLSGVGRWVAALRRHAVDLLVDAAPLLRRVHELYDTSLAGPRGPSMRESGGASGYLQLQQRWLRDRGHSELLVSAHRALQALGNTIAAVALTDSVLAELCVCRAPHLLPLAASALQADQQAHAALKAMANAESNLVTGTGMVKPASAPAVPPPPRGAGLAGLLLGQPLPPGLMHVTQSAVQAATLVQDRLQEQLPSAFGLPGLWRALHECLIPSQLAKSEPLLSGARLWSVVQVQLSCLTPEEQVIHTMNVGDGVYVSAAALVQLAAGAAIAPGSVLHGDTMTQLQHAVVLEQLKAELATTAAHTPSCHTIGSAVLVEKATLDQLKAWSTRADVVRLAWDRALQLTVGAGTTAAKLSGQRSARSDSAGAQTTRALDAPSLVSCSGEPWAYLTQQGAAAGAAVIVRAAAAATAPPPQPTPPQLQQITTQSQGAPGSRGQAPSQGRPSSQPGMVVSQAVQQVGRNPPPRPPPNMASQQPAVNLHRNSLNGPPLPPRVMAAGPVVQFGRSSSAQLDLTAAQQQQQQQQQPQPLQQLRAASQVLMKSPRGEGSALGTYGMFTMAGSTAAQSRSRAASSLGDWGHME